MWACSQQTLYNVHEGEICVIFVAKFVRWSRKETIMKHVAVMKQRA